jgi:hypothetical protein
MRRHAVIVVVVVVASVIAILALSLRTTSLAFTIGVNVAGPVATLERGDQTCQRPIDVPAHAAFDRIMFSVGTFGREGSPLAVTVQDARGSVLSSGALRGGYADIGQQQSHTVRLTRQVGEGRVAVCIRNEGPRRVAVYGNVDAAARTSSAYTNGRRLDFDLALVFERDRRTKLSLVPDILERASLFRFPWMNAWAYVILLVALVVGGPVLIVRALRSTR